MRPRHREALAQRDGYSVLLLLGRLSSSHGTLNREPSHLTAVQSLDRTGPGYAAMDQNSIIQKQLNQCCPKVSITRSQNSEPGWSLLMPHQAMHDKIVPAEV